MNEKRENHPKAVNTTLIIVTVVVLLVDDSERK